MNILITGGLGFIGTATANALKKNHSVYLYDLKANQDILDIKKLEATFASIKPEIVYHFAAQASVVTSLRNPFYDANNNILGTIAVLEQCKKWGAKIVYSASGGTAYGGRKNKPFTESDASNPYSPYGISKYTGELYIKSSGINYTILRYANVYGPGQSSQGEAGVIAIFIDRIIKKEKPLIRGDGAHTRDYVFINDVVNANIMAINWSGTLNIGTGIATSVIEIYKLIANALNYKNGYGLVDPTDEIDHVEAGWV